MTSTTTTTISEHPLYQALEQYRHQQPAELIGDPADADRPFAVEFDSLFALALADCHAPYSPLALIGALERHLSLLSISGRFLHVLHLDDLDDLWRTTPTLMLLRSIAIDHVRRAATNPSIRLSSTSIPYSSFVETMSQMLPSLMIITSPTSLPSSSSSSSMMVPDRLPLALLHLTHCCLGDTHIRLFHYQDIYNIGPATYGVPAFNVRRHQHQHPDDDNLAVLLNTTYDVVFSKQQQQIVEELDQLEIIDDDYDGRDQTNVVTNDELTDEALAMTTTISDAVRSLWRLHCRLLQVMPLSRRCNVVDGPYDQLQSSVDDICRSLSVVLRRRHRRRHRVESVNNHIDSMIDLFDVRLLAALCDRQWRRDIVNEYRLDDDEIVAALSSSSSSLLPEFNVRSCADVDDDPLLSRPFARSTLIQALSSSAAAWGSAEARILTNPSAPANAIVIESLPAELSLPPPPSSVVAASKSAATTNEAQEDKWRRKQAQLFALFLDKYSANLTDGVTRRRDVVLATPTTTTTPSAAAGAAATTKQGKKGGKGKTKPGKIDVRAAASAAVAEKQMTLASEKVAGFCNQADRMALGDGVQFIESKLSEVDEIGVQFPIVAARTYIALCQKWRLYLKESRLADRNPAELAQIQLGLFCAVRDLDRMYGPVLTADHVAVMIDSLNDIALTTIAVKLARKYKLKPPAPAQVKAGELSSERFQLQIACHRLVRDVRSTVDPRVSFIPDAWQVEMIDAVDARSSLLVVAPTSSGKTFVSYYCMEKIISNNKANAGRNFERVVFVMPTKALVNQIVADIYKRYGQRFGVLTDDQADATSYSAEILITIPSSFHARLMSNAPDDIHWVNSVRYTIFDEVHMIVDVEIGSVWERCIALVPSPVICLSATVGNVGTMREWLATLQQRKGHRIVFVEYRERWNDHAYQVYIPTAPTGVRLDDNQSYTIDDPEWQIGRRSNDPLALQARKLPSRLVPLHPVGLWSTTSGRATIERYGTIPDMGHLSPAEALSLYDQLVASQSDPAKRAVLMKTYSPESYFRADTFISQCRAREWAGLLVNLSQSDDDYRQVPSQLLKPITSGLDRINALTPSDRFDFAKRHFFDALLELDRLGRLPVIVFCLSRERCSDVVTSTIRHLIAMSPAPVSKLSEADKVKARKELVRLKEKLEKKKSKEGDEQLAEQIAALESDIFSEPVQDRRFTFAGYQRSSQDADFWLNRLKRSGDWSSDPVKQLLLRGLELGIGLHHAGVDKKYRDAVEALFRMGQVRVVVATTTLSVGINMPCRTVMLLGSFRLNPLLFRQMIGRAGRRGYDYQGHVVFLGLDPNRIASLTCHQLTALYSTVAVDTTVSAGLARLLQGLHYQKEIGLCARRIATLLSCPLAGQGVRQGQHYLFLMSLDLLSRYRLLNADAAAADDRSSSSSAAAAVLRDGRLMPLLGALQSHDPANLLLVDLIASGTLPAIADAAGSAEKAAMQLLKVLAHIFHRRDLSLGHVDNALTLEPLPDDVRDVIRAFNRHNRRVAVQYLRQLAHDDPSSTALSFSGESRPHWRSSSSSRPISVRSVFDALSNGRGDEFSDNRDLSLHIRSDYRIFLKAVPLADRIDSPASNYVVAFYKNDRTYANLLKAAGMLDESMWASLKLWSVTLQHIASALSTPGDKSLMARGFAVLSSNFNDLFNSIGAI